MTRGDGEWSRKETNYKKFKQRKKMHKISQAINTKTKAKTNINIKIHCAHVSTVNRSSINDKNIVCDAFFVTQSVLFSLYKIL